MFAQITPDFEDAIDGMTEGFIDDVVGGLMPSVSFSVDQYIDLPTLILLLATGATFMVITTIAALAWQAYRFFTAPQPNWFLGSASIVLIGLALFVGNEGLQALKGPRGRPEPAQSEA